MDKYARINRLLFQIEAAMAELREASGQHARERTKENLKKLDEKTEICRKLTDEMSGLQNGIAARLTTEQHEQELEDRYNIHPGSIYRCTIHGSGGGRHFLTYDGTLKEAEIHIHDDGTFTIDSVVLEDGLCIDDADLVFGRTKHPFDKVLLTYKDSISEFGRIRDEEGFQKAKKRYTGCN